MISKRVHFKGHFAEDIPSAVFRALSNLSFSFMAANHEKDTFLAFLGDYT